MKPHIPFLLMLSACSLAATAPPPPPLDSRSDILFKSFVFAGDKLPACAFEHPAEAKEALGSDCSLKTTYYDANFQAVTTAAKPGRYGAIVEIHAPHMPFIDEINRMSATMETRAGGSLVAKRYFTLFKQAHDVDWKTEVHALAAAPLPAGLGLDPAVAGENSAMVGDFAADAIKHALNHDDRPAAMLACLSETKPRSRRGVGSDTRWIVGVETAWWDHLRSQTGDLPDYKYLTWLPKGYEVTNKPTRWPLIVFLHGSGERGLNVEEVRRNGLPHWLGEGHDLPAIVIAPQCAPDDRWLPSALNRMLDDLMKKYRVDPDRILLTGLSMGGFGTWAWGEANPERFAALVPICGGGDPDGADNLKNLPIWAFHGGKDPTVPLAESRSMVDAVNAVHGRAKLTIFPDAGHDSWTQAYAEPALYPWLLAQKRGTPAPPQPN